MQAPPLTAWYPLCSTFAASSLLALPPSSLLYWLTSQPEVLTPTGPLPATSDVAASKIFLNTDLDQATLLIESLPRLLYPEYEV